MGKWVSCTELDWLDVGVGVGVVGGRTVTPDPKQGEWWSGI